MKILKNNLTEPIKCTCSDCGSIFEFDYRDIQRREEMSFGLFANNTISKRFVICPVCAYENEYNNSKVIKEKLNAAMDAFEKHSFEKENNDER